MRATLLHRGPEEAGGPERSHFDFVALTFAVAPVAFVVVEVVGSDEDLVARVPNGVLGVGIVGISAMVDLPTLP